MRDAVPLLGVVGAVLYGVLRLSYVFFYLQLRATPEEVGYGYVEVLAGQLVGAIELVVVLSAVFIVVGVIARVGIVGWSWRTRGTRRPGPVWPRAWWARTALRASALGTLAVLVGLPVIAWTAGGDAAHGFTVRNVYLLHTIRLPILAVQAVPATVGWTGADSEAGRNVEQRQCLLYLGKSADIAVFYDVQSQDSVRVSAGDVVITLRNKTAVPLGCDRRPKGLHPAG